MNVIIHMGYLSKEIELKLAEMANGRPNDKDDTSNQTILSGVVQIFALGSSKTVQKEF